MPIAVHSGGSARLLLEEAFTNEAELQACLERSPELLSRSTRNRVVMVQREVNLPAAGLLDLLMVDEEGVPIAVEVKLRANAESRRQVVAQAFDYVASLSGMTFEEVDQLVEGSLDGAIRQLVGAANAEAVRRRCAANLRAGFVRLIIAVDEASTDLIRIVQYVAEHSDTDVSLVKFRRFDEGRILVPTVVVDGSLDLEARRGMRTATSQRDADPAFLAVVEAYDRSVGEELRTVGVNRSYRQIRFERWPTRLHYEFVDHDDEVGIELHLENDLVSPLSAQLRGLVGEDLLPALKLEWDQRFCAGRGRLLVKISKEQPPERSVKAMQALIQRTKDVLDRFVANLGAPPAE